MTTERVIEIKRGSEVGASEKNKNRKYLKRTCPNCGDIKWVFLKAMWRAAMMSHQLCAKCAQNAHQIIIYKETTNR